MQLENPLPGLQGTTGECEPHYRPVFPEGGIVQPNSLHFAFVGDRSWNDHVRIQGSFRQRFY